MRKVKIVILLIIIGVVYAYVGSSIVSRVSFARFLAEQKAIDQEIVGTGKRYEEYALTVFPHLTAEKAVEKLKTQREEREGGIQNNLRKLIEEGAK